MSNIQQPGEKEFIYNDAEGKVKRVYATDYTGFLDSAPDGKPRMINGASVVGTCTDCGAPILNGSAHDCGGGPAL